MNYSRLISFAVIAASLGLGGINGCTQKPNKDDVAKLEESKIAAESAEKKLYDLKQERMKLEAEKQSTQKQGEDK